MSLEKRGAIWHYDFWIDGVRYRGSTKRRSKADAGKVETAARQAALNETQLGTRVEAWTLGDAIDAWWKAVGQRKTSGSDEHHTLQRLIGNGKAKSRLSAAPYTLKASMPFASLDEQVLMRLRDERSAEGHGAASINREMSALRGLWTFADRRKVKVANIRYWPREKEAPKLRWLTVEEEARLLAVVGRLSAPAWLSTISIVLLDTGLRKGEALGLLWSDVELDADVPLLRVFRPKTGGYTTLNLTRRAVEGLKLRKKARLGQEPKVFAGIEPTLKPLYATIDQAGLNDDEARVAAYGRATIHTFRHTFASRLVQAGVDLYRVQKLLGHTTMAMTARYAHLAPDAGAAQAVDVLNAVVRPTNLGAVGR